MDEKRSYDRYTAEQRRSYNNAQYSKRMYEYRERFGNKCAHCGWDAVPEVLEFAHRKGETKVLSISNCMRGHRNLVEEELAKCILLCPTCHRIYDWASDVNGSMLLLQSRCEGSTPSMSTYGSVA